MSLNKFCDINVKKEWMNIHCNEIKCNKLITDIIEIDNLEVKTIECDDIKINDELDATNINVVNADVDNLNSTQIITDNLEVKTIDNNLLSYKTPNLGLVGQILQSDGVGGVLWGAGLPPSSGIVYDGVLPSTIGNHVKLSNTLGNEVNSSLMNEIDNNLYMNDLSIVGANSLRLNTIQSRDTGLNIETEADDLNINSNAVNIISNDLTWNSNTVATLNDITTYNQSLNTYDNVGFNEIQGTTLIRCPVIRCQAISTIDVNPLQTISIGLGGFKTSIDSTYLYSYNFIKYGGVVGEYLMADGSVSTAPSITLQNAYDNSIGISNPATVNINYGDSIKFVSDDSDNILSIRSDAINNNYISSDKAIITDLNSTYSTSNQFIKNGGTNSQYLMADGSVSTASSIGSNIYYYQFDTSISTPPPIQTGHISFNTATVLSISNVYISHTTDDNTDIDPFFTSIQPNNILYIQDKNDSTKWIKFTVISTSITLNSFINITVSYLSSSVGFVLFNNNHQIYFSIFSTNTIPVITLNSVGSGNSLISSNVSPNFTTKSIIAGTNISLSATANDITINSTGGSSSGQGLRFNPLINNTLSLGGGPKSYFYQLIIDEPTTINGFSVYMNAGGDPLRVGIYRGFVKSIPLSNGILVGQSASVIGTSGLPYTRTAITAVSGQNLNFVSGEYMVIGFSSSGIANTYLASTAMIGNYDMAFVSSSNYVSAGFPSPITTSTQFNTLANKICLTLY
jgi:hypothetical protein